MLLSEIGANIGAAPVVVILGIAAPKPWIAAAEYAALVHKFVDLLDGVVRVSAAHLIRMRHALFNRNSTLFELLVYVGVRAQAPIIVTLIIVAPHIVSRLWLTACGLERLELIHSVLRVSLAFAGRMPGNGGICEADYNDRRDDSANNSQEKSFQLSLHSAKDSIILAPQSPPRASTSAQYQSAIGRNSDIRPTITRRGCHILAIVANRSALGPPECRDTHDLSNPRA